MDKKKQFRLNLAFRADNATHMDAYKRLMAIDKRTDYISSLMMRESKQAEQSAPVIDMQALSMVIEEAVNKAVKEALAGVTVLSGQDGDSTTSQGAVPSDMELGMKGLNMFY